jgi:hypothetical protein
MQKKGRNWSFARELKNLAVTDCKSRELKLATTPKDIFQSLTNAWGLIAPATGYITLCGFSYPCVYLRFFYLNGTLSHFIYLYLTKKVYLSHHLVADTGHLFIQVKDIFPNPRGSGCRSSTNTVTGLYENVHMKRRICFSECLPPCVISPKNSKDHLTYVNEILAGDPIFAFCTVHFPPDIADLITEYVKPQYLNIFHHFMRGKNQKHPSLLNKVTNKRVINQTNRTSTRQGPVFERADWRKVKDSSYRCPGTVRLLFVVCCLLIFFFVIAAFNGCVCHSVVARLRSSVMPGLVPDKAMDLIVASVPSSLGVNGREELHTYWASVGAQIPDRTCYFSGVDVVIPKKKQKTFHCNS